MLELTDNRNELNLFFEPHEDGQKLRKSHTPSIKIVKLS